VWWVRKISRVHWSSGFICDLHRITQEVWRLCNTTVFQRFVEIVTSAVVITQQTVLVVGFTGDMQVSYSYCAYVGSVRNCPVFVETVHRFLHDINKSVQGLAKGFIGVIFKCHIRNLHVYWFVRYCPKFWGDSRAGGNNSTEDLGKGFIWEILKCHIHNVHLSVIYTLLSMSWGDYSGDLSKVVITRGRTGKMVCTKEVFVCSQDARANKHTHTHTLSLSLSQTHTHTHTHRYTCMHTYIHTHIYIYILILLSSGCILYFKSPWWMCMTCDMLREERLELQILFYEILDLYGNVHRLILV
jgi:hypothetical protein